METKIRSNPSSLGYFSLLTCFGCRWPRLGKLRVFLQFHTKSKYLAYDVLFAVIVIVSLLSVAVGVGLWWECYVCRICPTLIPSIFRETRGSSAKGGTAITMGMRSLVYAPNWSSSTHVSRMSNRRTGNSAFYCS